jgi:hypothetical protein
MKPVTQGVLGLLFLPSLVAGLCLISPEALAQGPALCLWRALFHITACPACGSTRALAAFFHGRLTDALALNRNVVVTGPLLLLLVAHDVLRLVQKIALRSNAEVAALIRVFYPSKNQRES